MELKKIIELSIMVIVLIFIYISISSFFNTTTSNIKYLSAPQDEMNCDSDFFNVAYCPEDSDCEDDKKETWKKFEAYLGEKNCDTLKSKPKSGVDEKLACTCVQQKIWDLKENNEVDLIIKNEYLSSDTYKSKTSTSLISPTIILEFKKTDFYSLIKSDFENFAKDNNLDVNILYSIVISEGAYENSFESKVRFECHIFNKYMKKNVLTCDCYGNIGCTGEKDSNFKSFSTNFIQTNYQAYLKAKEINNEFAFKSSSFGFGQIMGFNLDYSLYGDLDKLKDVSIQSKQFFDYLIKNKLINDLKEKNWNSIAKIYNGPAYAQNNYQNKLKNNYETLVS